jgi:MoaA/NifB/PqqE/SkfB family radical SAM enzyme
MLNVTTNGLNSKLVENKARDIAEARVPLTFINVSLDGPAQIHDYVRGVKGAYKNAVKTLGMLRMLSDEYSNLSVGFEYTVTSFNAGYLKLLIDELPKAELSWLLRNLTINLYHEGNLYKNLERSSKQQFTNNLFKFKVLEDLGNGLKLSNVRSPLALVSRTYLKRAQKYVLDETVSLRCVALRNSLFLDPYGTIYPCIILGREIGNLRNYNYDVYELLKSKNALKIKNEIENCSSCWTPCEAYPSILTHLSSFIKACE